MAMDMEAVRSSLAALLLLTLVVLAASASGGDDPAAAVEKEKQCHHRTSSGRRRRALHALVTFQNKDGEEIRILADKGSATLAPFGFANRSGHWFYNRRRRLPSPSNTPSSRGSRTDAEGFWNTLGALANATAASGDPDDDEQGYMLVGMQTSGGDKIRLVVVAGQRYFFITGFAKGWFRPPNWFFRDGERHRLLTSLGGNGSSHEEFVASNVLAAMVQEGEACCG